MQGATWPRTCVGIVCGAFVLVAAATVARRETPLPRRGVRPVIARLELAGAGRVAESPSPETKPVLADPGMTPGAIREAEATARSAERAEALSTLRSHAGPFEKRMAIFRLWNARQVDEEVVEAIMTLLATSPTDEDLLGEALLALKDSPRADVSSLTQAYLRSSSATVRLAAAKALHFSKGEEVSRALSAQASIETEDIVRRRLVLALGTRMLTDSTAAEELERMARLGRDETLRGLAAEMLRDGRRMLATLSNRE